MKWLISALRRSSSFGGPRRGRGRIAGHGLDQHVDRRGLAVAAPTGGDEEARAAPSSSERSMMVSASGDEVALPVVVGGDVDQPLVAQELHRRLDALGRAVLRASG